jgi:hypothetical protein
MIQDMLIPPELMPEESLHVNKELLKENAAATEDGDSEDGKRG